MNIEIKKSKAQGAVIAPPSKSYAHRLLICAALSEGVSVISNVNLSQDISATLACLKSMGASYVIDGDKITIQGMGAKPKISDDLRCGESGSTLRFIIPIALLSGSKSKIYGTEKLISRGIGVYTEALKDCAEFSISNDEIIASGKLESGTYKVKGNVSSQFISGLMFALPTLQSDSVIEILGPVESRSYIDITIDALKTFGVIIKQLDGNRYFIMGNQKYKPQNLAVEGDWSNAAFLFALKALGGDVTVNGLNYKSYQGDKVCLEIFEKIEKGNAIIDLSDCPDLAPISFAIAALKGGARFIGTKRLAIKESNRAQAMAQELKKFGASLLVEENAVTVENKALKAPSQTLSGHNDHRIVMSMAVLSTVYGGVIEGYQAVAKSYPDFFNDLKSLGVEINYDA